MDATVIGNRRTARHALGRATAACLLALLLTTGAMAQALRSPADAAPALDRVVKAVFLFKFLDYVELPAHAFADASAPYVIGVYGADDIARELAQAVAGRKLGERAIEVRRLRRGDPLTGLHMLFVGAAESPQLPALARAAQGQPLLLVTEDDRGLTAGTAINLVVVDGKVRFDVALDPAARAGIRLSSRLLSVARSVRTGSM